MSVQDWFAREYENRLLICSRCGNRTDNAHQGHYWSFCRVSGKDESFHFCCPDDCELHPVDNERAEGVE